MVIVFVHGIFSSCAVFETLKKAIRGECPGPPRFVDFKYNFLDPLHTNAGALNAHLAQTIQEGEEVAIVAHSMGGLVSRMALLTGHDDRSYHIRTLVMLATPNHGAVKMSQIHGIVGLLRSSVNKIPPLYSRSRGLDDLTRVNTIINDLFASDGASIGRTKGVDYVTIPALIYNEDAPTHGSGGQGFTAKVLGFIASISAHRGSLHLKLPHDGIVEETSVRMVSDAALYQTERTRYSTDEGRKALGRTGNVHIIHPDLRTANHVEIHSIPRVCALVAALLNSASIDAWKASLDEDERNVLHLSNGGLI